MSHQPSRHVPMDQKAHAQTHLQDDFGWKIFDRTALEASRSVSQCQTSTLKPALKKESIQTACVRMTAGRLASPARECGFWRASGDSERRGVTQEMPALVAIQRTGESRLGRRSGTDTTSYLRSLHLPSPLHYLGFKDSSLPPFPGG